MGIMPNRMSQLSHIEQLVERARSTAREQGLSALVLKGLRYPVKPLFVPGAVEALKQERRRIRSLDQLYEFVNGFNHRGITITTWQKKAEIASLLGSSSSLRQRESPR